MEGASAGYLFLKRTEEEDDQSSLDGPRQSSPIRK
jgi:hypothetical protein